MKFTGRLVALLVSICATIALAQEQPTAEQIEFFEKKIRPVFVKHCYECHSSESKPVKGGLSLETRDSTRRGGDSGAAVVPEKIDASLLIAAVRYEDVEMPPKGKLSDSVINDLVRWVEMGAPDPRDDTAATVAKGIDYERGLSFWAFQPVHSPQPPTPSDMSWCQNEIDRFVLARLDANGMTPSKAASRRALIRRAYFGVIGLPPTPEEVEAFVHDTSEDAYRKVVDRLLDSEHYGERWGRHWLDVARYGEDQAHTFKARKYPLGYRYRDWVVKALNDDLPYDKFLMYQIAGDLVDDPDRHERLAALGLFALGPVYYQDNGEKAKALADEWDDRVDTLMRGVLGLTAACARCHDHKYDPISMEDYYGLAGIFAASQYQERPIVSEQVLRQKTLAEASMKEGELSVNRYLSEQAKLIRPHLVDQIPQLVATAWKVENRLKKEKDKKKREKLFADAAKQDKVSLTLLKRWRDYLFDDSEKDRPRPHLKAWREWVGKQSGEEDLSKDESLTAAARQHGEMLKQRVESLEPRREQLLKRFGSNVAFVKKEDQVKVVPGQIPLGNLFDDSKGTPLDAALASDKYNASAGADDLGVNRVVQGWGATTEIAPGVKLDFRKLGSDGSKHSAIVNDAWGGGSLSTRGKPIRENRRREQGIGMHANALITFDLDEIRRAGLLPQDQRFVFRVGRAGLNDDVFGSQSPSAYMAVILLKPHKKPSVFDAILAGYVNGVSATIDENDTVYYFGGELPKPLKADGKFAVFEIPVPAEAKFLTLVATGAGGGADDNTINSDHTVFSGARLELDPPANQQVATTDGPSDQQSVSEQDRVDAVLLSEFFYDTGLLGVPAQEVEPWLGESEKTRLIELRDEFAKRKKSFEVIEVPKAHALTEGKSADLKVYLQGDPTKQGEIARRAFPAVFTGGKRLPFETNGSGRLELAKSIADPRNPLTARVIVNRIWQGHFGFGLVRTPSNFGNLGERPSHPELLDYLASQLVNSGWSMKSIHRQILLSATYQQSSEYRSELADKDPENRLLWRMNRRRLEVEPWRDAMLAVSGKLDRSLGGPSGNLDDANNQRRTLYGFVSRHRLNELLRLFDFPDPNISSDKRPVTTVPLQQLFVLNSDFMLRQANALTDRLSKEGKDDRDRIERAFALLYSRSPSEDELQAGLGFLDAVAEAKQAADKLNAWQQYALVLLGANEFAFID